MKSLSDQLIPPEHAYSWRHKRYRVPRPRPAFDVFDLSANFSAFETIEIVDFESKEFYLGRSCFFAWIQVGEGRIVEWDEADLDCSLEPLNQRIVDLKFALANK